MSIRVGRDEAEQRFSELLSKVSQGEEIEIVSDGEELARLIPSSSTQSHMEVGKALTGLDPHGHFNHTYTPVHKFVSAIQCTYDQPWVASHLIADGNFESFENPNELNEILDSISLVQSRMEADRLEIDNSFRNIDNMLTSIED